MEIAFFVADKEREQRLADAFIEGLGPDDVGYKVAKSKQCLFGTADAVCMVGVKSHDMFGAARAAGKHVIYFDKGYFRHRGPNRTWEYWRICVDDHHPTAYVGAARHGCKRWDKIAHRRGVELKDWRETGHQILYAGSSDKYHAFCGLPDPTTYAIEIFRQIRKVSDRKIVYRPKPTWLEAEAIAGSELSGRDKDIGSALRSAWCMVTNGSNAAFEAICNGIPCVVLGNGIAKPISSQSIDDIETVKLPSYHERNQWLWNIAWCMFTEEEMKHGLAWAAIKPQFTNEFVDDLTLPYIAGRSLKGSKAMRKKYSSDTAEERAQFRRDKAQAKLQRRINKMYRMGKVRDEGPSGQGNDSGT